MLGEKSDGASHDERERRRRIYNRMRCTKSVIAAFHSPQHSESRRKLGKTLALSDTHGFIRITVHDQPGDANSSRRRGNIEPLFLARFHIIEQRSAESHVLTRSRIVNVRVSGVAPDSHVFVRPASNFRYRRPRDERFHVLIKPGVKNCNTTTARVAEQSEAFVANTFSPACFGNYFTEICELLGERLRLELLELAEVFAIRSYAVPGEVERDRAHSIVRKRLSEVGKERPVRESLEAVANHDRSNRIAIAFRMKCLAAHDERLC